MPKILAKQTILDIRYSAGYTTVLLMLLADSRAGEASVTFFLDMLCFLATLRHLLALP